MALQPGARLGPYEIVEPLGAGGMGEVYRARDSKLNRDVAIKVLLASVANDPDRLARFSREAQVLASLNHPNIANIHGIEDADGTRALVMELVEGPTLADRIAQGPIPLDEALPIAKQIAEALEAAHEQGVIHRDLKPANIKVRPDGTVKVLDFGLAKAMDPAGASSANAMNSPTLSMHATQAGIILGTAAYMSPEQARGTMVDRRADIWAFGVVLFEMLTGRRAFEGDTITDVIAAVVTREPDWNALPPTASSGLRRLLARCLKKDPKRRLQAIGEARVQIEEVLAGAPDDPAPLAIPHLASGGATNGRWRMRAAWTITSLALTGLLATLFVVVPRSRQPPPDTRPMRFTIAPPQGATWTFGSRSSEVVVSPDGSRLAFVAAGEDNRGRLWVRSLESLDAQALPGTENARSPFWSPDGRFLAFFADGKLKRIELAGAVTPQTVSTLPHYTGGTWNRAGVILLGSPSGLIRISSTGGEPVPAVSAEPASDASLRWPQFLPDGTHFTYVVSSSDEARKGVFIGALDSSATKRIMAGDSNVVYAPPGYLMFARGATIMAQAIDLDRLELTGDPIPVAEHVERGLPLPFATFSVSDTGVLVYRTEEAENAEQLVWLDRAGSQLGTVGPPGESRVPVLSRDGSKIAIDRLDSERGTRDVRSIDVARGFSTPLTSHPANDFAPLWSPDGTRVIFASDRDGPQAALYQKGAISGGTEEVILGTGGDKRAHDWSHDGRYLLYSDAAALWVLPMMGERRPMRLSQTDAPYENRGHFSPDARWIAYDSRAEGLSEVYARRFPPSGQQWRVSTNGGWDAQWRGDGKELFYLDLNGTLMAASVKTGAQFEASIPRPLFETPLKGHAAQGYSARSSYAVSADGQRFLFAQNIDVASTSPITVVLNWAAALRK